MQAYRCIFSLYAPNDKYLIKVFNHIFLDQQINAEKKLTTSDFIYNIILPIQL